MSSKCHRACKYLAKRKCECFTFFVRQRCAGMRRTCEGEKKKVKQILKANRKELDSKRVANAVPTGAARIALLNLDLSSLSLSLSSPLFLALSDPAISSRQKISSYDFSHDVTLVPRCLIMTLCSLTRYNLKRGIPRKKTEKELWRERYVVTRKMYRKRDVLYFFSLSSLSFFFSSRCRRFRGSKARFLS